MRDAFGSPQTLLVLGGTSDIGVATAEAMIARGTRRVVLAGRDPRSLGAVKARLRRAGSELATPIAFDALATEDHEQFVEQVFTRYGDIDVVLLTFGVYGDPKLCDVDVKAAREVIETNFLGAVSVTVPLAERMRAQGHGVLVVLSSVAAERPRQSEYVYAASKAGLDAFFQGLADSLAGTGVRVLVVRPGFVLTKMNLGRRPKPWATSPEAVAQAIVHGLERNAHTIWVPSLLRWAMVVVRHLPRSAFRKITAVAERRGLD
jgi:decaprenylphospho-beta-D-erythro-pentofuranosid-2-ulose 2-reductase